MQIEEQQQSRISEQLSNYSQEAQDEEIQKSKYKPSKLKDLFPINYYEQKSYFFQRQKKYNPYFTYKGMISPQIRQIHTEYEQLAHKILINNAFKASQEPNLQKQEVIQTINGYLQKIGLEDFVQINFQKDCLSRTSVVYYQNKIILKIREPISYNKVSLEGVLNHEIGTHVVRYLNHKENSQRKTSDESKVFEEGLAAINQLLPEERPFLFKAALRYNAAIQASKYSFIDLYKFISKYIHDQNDCWRETVRAKRGHSNTEKAGAYSKDQNYLIGAVQILRNRKNIDFQKCFYSKLSAEQGKNIKSGVLPPFMDSEQKRKHYLRKIQAIAICNFIEEIDICHFIEATEDRKRSYEHIEIEFE